MSRAHVRSALLLIALVCWSGTSPTWALEVVAPPTLTMNPNLVTPLAGVVRLSTDVPSRVTLHVTDGTRGWAVVFPDYSTDHAVPVLGLQPDHTYTVVVMVTDEVGSRLVLSPPLPAVTGPLPADFPAITLLASNPVRMEPGFTMMDKFTRANGDEGSTYAFMVDSTGAVVWYAPRGGIAMNWLPTGTVLYRASTLLMEADLLGNLVNLVTLADPGHGLHHELFRSASDTHLTLSRANTVVDDYPTSLTDPLAPKQTATIEDNPIVEFGVDGALLNVWPLAGLIDPTRVGYDALSLPRGGYDWAHANAVIDSPMDDSLVVSVRHQDAIVKFSRDGRLTWILAPHENWSPAYQPFLLEPIGTPFSWSFHPHAPAWTPDGTLLVFDNGNYRASPFDGASPMAPEDSYSRVVEYRIDEEQMTVQQVWEYSPSGIDRLYTPAKSDVDWLPTTGNVLITYSVVAYVGGEKSCALGLGSQHTRIQEVDHGTPAQKVFEVAIYDASDQVSACPDLEIYRSERIPSLYPSTVSVLHAPALTLAAKSNQVRRGGAARYVVTVTNPASTRECYDYWANLTLPDGSIAPAAGEFVGPVSFCLDPFSTASRTFYQPVPTGAQVGPYTYHAHVGTYPLVLTQTDGPFYVTP